MAGGEAKVAFDSHDWDGVIAALEVAGDLDELNPDELTLLADALYWTGRFEDSLNAFDKAFSRFVKDGRSADAGRIAALLADLGWRRMAEVGVCKSHCHTAGRFRGGRIELQVPLPQGAQVTVFVTQEPVDDFYDLVLAFEDDLGLWDDDEEGWGE